MGRKKSPFHDDYGGNKYGSRYRTTHGTAGNVSMKCDECGKICYLTRRQLGRAWRPQCSCCGGMLIETDSESKRHREERVSVVQLDPLRRYRCKACGQNVGTFTAYALASHLMMSEGCIEYYLNELEIFLTRDQLDNSHLWIFGTAYVVKRTKGDAIWKYPWAIQALSGEGILKTASVMRRQMDAKFAIKGITKGTCLDLVTGEIEPCKEWQLKIVDTSGEGE